MSLLNIYSLLAITIPADDFSFDIELQEEYDQFIEAAKFKIL